MNPLVFLRTFWRSFMISPLYETGFADAVEWCGATTAATEPEMQKAMAYMKGYADACRIACPYMSNHWQVAHLVGIAAGTFMVAEGRHAELCATYTAELTELLAKRVAS